MSEAEVFYLMKMADKSNNGSLSVEEVSHLFQRINFAIGKSDIKKLFKSIKVLEELKYEDFKKIHTLIVNQNSNEKELFDLLSEGNGETINSESFKKFTHTIQKDDVSCSSDGVTFEIFLEYLRDEQYGLYDYDSRKQNMDMSRPWTEYYINSSHNTYLTGNQLNSESSLDAYTRALTKGCRCVELDCWDSPKGPVVYHGHTLTSKIFFRDIVKTINRDAFNVTNFPLIISLEVHCSLEGQDEMANILIEELGHKLLQEKLDCEITPESLLGKVIIKGKSLPLEPSKELDSGSSDSLSEILEESSAKKSAKKKHHKLSEKLGKLAIYQISKKLSRKKDIDSQIEAFTNENVASLSETSASNMISLGLQSFINFTSKAFVRIYPKGDRVDSSNYDPMEYWKAGCQIVALSKTLL